MTDIESIKLLFVLTLKRPWHHQISVTVEFSNYIFLGGLAGLSMLFQRNSTLALYVLSKVGEVRFCSLF